MAAVLTRSRRGRAESRLSARFRDQVVPGLAALEGARQRYRLGYGAALAAMLVGIFLIFLWVGDLENALFVGGVVAALGFVLMQLAQRGYSVQVRRAVMPAICEAIGDPSSGPRPSVPASIGVDPSPPSPIAAAASLVLASASACCRATTGGGSTMSFRATIGRPPSRWPRCACAASGGTTGVAAGPCFAVSSWRSRCRDRRPRRS